MSVGHDETPIILVEADEPNSTELPGTVHVRAERCEPAPK